MPVESLPIITSYNQARFIQANSEDCANWYQVPTGGKGKLSLYPTMGRKKITLLDEIKLNFRIEPREIFETIDYMYAVVGSRIIQIDRFYNQIELAEDLNLSGEINWAWLAVSDRIYIMVTDEEDVFVVTEGSDGRPSIEKSTTDTPENPTYVAVFGNRFLVSTKDTPTWTLSQIELGGDPKASNSTWFTIPGGIGSLFAQASGKIQQLGVLKNQLYIFTSFNVDVWANVPTEIDVAGSKKTFPFKKSTAYNWDVGLENPKSLSIDFGMMTWLARNKNGLVTFMASSGGQPKEISSEAINVLLESQVQDNGLSPFLSRNAVGFLYQWENSIFYRVTAGKFLEFGELDLKESRNALEYNFKTKTWSRLIELNGERNRISKHVYFNNKHIVIVENQSALFEMRGDVYTNDIQKEENSNTFTKKPMRYELLTEQIYKKDYSEFITDYIEIDFVYGDKTFNRSTAPFDNTVYLTDEDGKLIVTEDSTDGDETFVIKDGTNTPTIDDKHYNDLFNPHIELYFSDDGGICFNSADLREFSNLGVYSWRMRWYNLGPSRNRVYKLVCVSAAPIVVLGGVQNIRKASGGNN